MRHVKNELFCPNYYTLVPQMPKTQQRAVYEKTVYAEPCFYCWLVEYFIPSVTARLKKGVRF